MPATAPSLSTYQPDSTVLCNLKTFSATHLDKSVTLQHEVGLFGLGKSGPAEESPTAGLPRPSDNQSTEVPKAFKGQGENDTEQRNELTDAGPSAATQVPQQAQQLEQICV